MATTDYYEDTPVAIEDWQVEPASTIGSPQYQQELARAQRGSGYINADVSPFGEVISPGYDPNARTPEQLLAEAKAEQMARRFKGQQTYAQLVKDGAKPEEALRLTAHDLFYNNPVALSTTIRGTTPRPALPTQMSAVPVRDAQGNVIAQGIPGERGGFQVIRPPTAAKAVMPPEVVAGQKNISGEITDTRRDLERAKGEMEKDPGNNDAARRALNYQNRLTELQQQFQQGSTNWMNRGESARPKVEDKKAEPKKAAEVIRVTKDGRRAVFDADTKAFIRYAD